jgi:hypothetical protein
MHSAFGVYVLNTLWSMMAGIRFRHSDLELKNLQGLLTELFANIDMVGCLFSQFPMLRFLAPELSGYKQFINIHQRVWKFLKVSPESLVKYEVGHHCPFTTRTTLKNTSIMGSPSIVRGSHVAL